MTKARDTNLSAEYFVLSVLHRLGLSATLTVGKNRFVDIVVTQPKGELVTIDVNVLAGKISWPVDNGKPNYPNHFYAFVCFHGKLEDPAVLPEIFVVPANRLNRLVTLDPTGHRMIRLKEVRSKGGEYRNAWRLLRRHSG